jgi:hypothetical protein
MAITYGDLKEELAEVEAAIRELVQTGQEYTIVGSHTIKNPKLGELQSRSSVLRKRMLRWNGVTGRTFFNV